jgi:hypothetical protein
MRKSIIIMLLLSIQFFCFAPGLNVCFIPSAEPLKKEYSYTEKLQAIIWCESSDGANRYNPGETEAVGLLQIHPIMVRDVNRILGFEKYQLSDRLSDKKSIEMFEVFQRHYNPSMNFERMAKTWCGGPSGMKKSSTLSYYNKALKLLNNG